MSSISDYVSICVFITKGDIGLIFERKGKTISKKNKQKEQEILFFLTTIKTIKDNFCFHPLYTLHLYVH